MQSKRWSPLLLAYASLLLRTSQVAADIGCSADGHVCTEGVTLTPGDDAAFIDLDMPDTWRVERSAPYPVLQVIQTGKPAPLVRPKRGVDSWPSYGITADCQKKKLELGKRVTQKEPLPPVAH